MAVFDRYLTEAEERTLFATVRMVDDPLARRDYAWMRLLRYTGIRVSTLAGLNCAHARNALRTGRLHIEAALMKGKRREHNGLATAKCQKALRDLLKARREMGFAEDPDAPLIVSRKRMRMSVRSFQARMQLWRTSAGLGCDASPHWFRHTLGKRLMKRSTARDPRGVAQGALDHASINSTGIYTRADKEEVDEAMQEVC